MQVGTTFAARYRVERLLGQGGTGTVALARDGERLVALKVAANATMAELSTREAEHAMKLAHEHVVRILDIGRTDEAPYVVMEYLRGANLAEVLSTRGALPVSEVLHHARQALEALEAARALDLVHLDIKPSNLFLGDSGNIKLLGGWKPRGEVDQAIVGSPAYMAPERLKRAPVDGRADIWAMGVTLYELLTATHPFVAATLQEMFINVLSKDAKPLREVPRGLDAIVARCLQRDPSARHETAAEVAAALAPFSEGVAE